MELSENQSDILEAAKSVTETLLNLMGVVASVKPVAPFSAGDEDVAAPSVALNIEGEDLGILIGRRGQTLASLQYIVKLIVGHQTQSRLPIIIDVEGYKQRHYESLQSLALRLAEEVKTQRTSFSLEPMPAFERRIIHLTLANHPDVYTESTGLGDARKVVILPKQIGQVD